MVTATSDARQPPFGGRGPQVLAAIAVVVALLAGAPAPEHGVRTAEAAATTARSAPSAASYELRSDTTRRPLRWPACRAIDYRIDPRGMPAGMDAVVKRVMAGIGRQTGATFRYAGTTKRAFTTRARPSTPTIYIGFTSKRKAFGHTFAYPGEIGIGGPIGGWWSSGDHRYEAITSGRVLLSTAFDGPLIGAGASWPSLIRHEVGHALNLAHRSSATAVMNPTLSEHAPTRFTPAEVAALNGALQRTGCDYGAWRQL